jgi:hypothetical protein
MVMRAEYTACCTSIVALADTGVEAAHQTGLYDTATGMPIFSTLGDDGSVIELYFFNPTTGAKTVTNTGFTKTAPATSTHESVAYETLSSGAVERLNKYVTITNGVAGAPTYTRFYDGEPYTVIEIKKVAPKPQKIQMGQEAFAVTGVSTSLPLIPSESNSQSQAFPQHAYIHVEVDVESTAMGIAYTTDGTDPAESATAKEFEVSAGNGFSLDTNQEIVGFRAVPLDGNGTPNDTLIIQLSVEYNNIGEDKDDV